MNAPRQRRTRKPWNADAAQADGCILTFEADGGDTLTLHRTGPLRAAIRAACDTALALDPSYRVVSYSTPQTIYVDLSGGRMDFDGASGHRIDPQSPEAGACAGAGLGHMLHPRLRLGHGDNDAQARRRARGLRAKP